MLIKRGVRERLLAVLTAVIISFTMYSPISAFAAGDSQDQGAAVKAQSAQQSPEADAEEPQEKAEKPESGEQKQDAAPEEQKSEDTDANTDADTDADTDSAETENPAADNADTDADETGTDAGTEDADDPEAVTLTNSDTPYLVKVTCGKDARIPEGAELIVKEKKNPDYIDRAAKELNADRVAFAVFLDISIVKDGEEIQPADEVKVAVALKDVPAEEDGEMAVVHFDGSADNPEAVKCQATGDDVRFDADGFSVYGFLYTVEFSYGEFSFAIRGGGEILLSEIFSRLQIEEDLTDSATECSAPELLEVKPVRESGTVTDWNLKSLKPFDTEETLTVDLANGDVVVITLTDDAQWGYANRDKGVIWELDDEGTLTLYVNEEVDHEGKNGAIRELLQSNGTTSAKAALQAATKKIVIKEGVTGIGWTNILNNNYNPQYPDSYPVTSAETSVFQDFNNLTTVETCSTIQRIGWSAFRKCKNLTSFDFNSMTNLEEIMNQAFSPCGLTSVDMSGCTSLKRICRSAFFNDGNGPNLTSVKLPAGLEVIGEEAFRKISTLSSVEFGDSLTTIYHSAFRNTGLTSVTLPATLTEIYYDAFTECKQLESVTFMDASKLTFMGNRIFKSCDPLTTVTDEATKRRAVTKDVALSKLLTGITSTYSSGNNPFAATVMANTDNWNLKVTVNDRTVTYNGKEQTGYEVDKVTGTGGETCTVSGLQEGHELSISDYSPSSGKNAGEYTNGAFPSDPEINAWSGGYDYGINYVRLSLTPGKLIIKKLPLLNVDITGHNDTKSYNGANQTASGYDFEAVDPEGIKYTKDDFTFSGSDKAMRKDAGKTEMGLASDQFKNINGNIETVTFNIKDDGYIEIEPIPATVTTGSASKQYDSKPLTNSRASISGLAPGDVVTVTATGSRTSVGSSTNTYSIDWGSVNSSNYNITEDLGTLTVTKADDPVNPDNPDDPAGPDDPDTPAGGNGGNARNAGNARNGAPAGAQALAGPNPPVATIEGDELPLAPTEEIADEETPMAPSPDKDHWSLLDLLLTLLVILIALLCLLLRRSVFGKPIETRTIGLILAILAVILLFLTQDFTQPMQITDKWTPLFGLILLAQAAVIAALSILKSDREQDA